MKPWKSKRREVKLKLNFYFVLHPLGWRDKKEEEEEEEEGDFLKINFGSCLQVAPLTCPNNIVIIAGSFTFRQHCARVSAWPCTPELWTCLGPNESECPPKKGEELAAAGGGSSVCFFRSDFHGFWAWEAGAIANWGVVMAGKLGIGSDGVDAMHVHLPSGLAIVKVKWGKAFIVAAVADLQKAHVVVVVCLRIHPLPEKRRIPGPHSFAMLTNSPKICLPFLIC